jgi:hypothetical protein
VTRYPDEEFTPMERAILEAYFDRLKSPAFPSVDGLSAGAREQCGNAAVMVYFNDDPAALPSPALSRGIFEHPLCIEMEGVEGHIVTVLWVFEGRPMQLELIAMGGAWDGQERPWRLLTERPQASA